jgi:hypothetical protein
MTTRDDYARAVMPGAKHAREAQTVLDCVHACAREALTALRSAQRFMDSGGYIRRSCLSLAIVGVSGLLRVVEFDAAEMGER